MNEDKTKTLLCAYNPQEDTDDNQFVYQDFIESFQEVINKTKCKGFYIEGYNLDWRNSSGSMETDLTDAQKLFDKVKPNTNDVTVEVYKLEKDSEIRDVDTNKCKFQMVIYHHDCPTGSKMYFYSRSVNLNG